MVQEATTVATQSVTVECATALDRALAALARKQRVSVPEVENRLRRREREAWGRFRFELAREVAQMLRQVFPQVESVYLWDLEEAEPEAAEAPAGGSLDLILRLEDYPPALDDLGVGIARELSQEFSRRVPGTPLLITIHSLTPAMLATGKGMATLFRSLHTPLVLVSAER